MSEAIENPEVQLMAQLMAILFQQEEDQRLRLNVVVERGVSGEWFSDPRHKAIFSGIAEIFKKGQVVDPYLVTQTEAMKETAGAAEEMEKLMDAAAPTTAHLEYYIEETKKRMLYRKVRKLTQQFYQEMKPEFVIEATETFSRALRELQDKLEFEDNDLKPLSAFVEESIKDKRELHMERFVKHNWKFMKGLPMPWDVLNQVYTGLKTGLHVIAAQASAGKSTFAVDLSAYWNQLGIKHGFVCIDMADAQLADRYPCVISQVSLAKLNFGGSANDLRLFEDGFRKASKDDNVWITEADDAKKIEELTYRGVKTLGWKAIIIDYIQLVSPDEKGQLPEYTKVQKATQAIKRLAKKLKIPIICLAQLSRKAMQDLREKGITPDLDALGDSAEIARAAASVLMIYKNDGMAKYWAETPPTQLAFGDRSDRLRNNAFIQAGWVSAARETPEELTQRRNGQLSLAKSLRPMWFDIVKNQQGGRGTYPFVMYPSYFLFRPGNHLAGVMEVSVGGKTQKLPVQQFEQLIDDWMYTEMDWILEATHAIADRSFKLAGETYEQMHERVAKEREAHRNVRQVVYKGENNTDYPQLLEVKNAN